MEPYDLEEVRREWIGFRTEPRLGRYPVEYDPIRRHCRMVEDTNPLFLDPEYAAGTRWGGVIAPPVMVEYFAGPGAWPPATEESTSLARRVPTRGERLINLNLVWEYHAPIRVGEHLSMTSEVIDVYEKPIGLDPLAVWIVTERRVTNQDGELIAVGRATLLTHRTPEQIAAAGGAS